jgi:spermidine synthase
MTAGRRKIDDESWCMIPGSMVGEQGMLRLREPAWSDRHELVERLRQGGYGRPFMVDDGSTRRLHFGLDFIQSEMSLGDPQALSLLYTQAMMAFLLFLPRPRHILIVGLGGGSLTKFCRREFPEARLTTVEIDQDVIDFAEWFDVPAPDARLRLVHADAADYFAGDNAPADVILLDGCDAGGIAPAFNNGAFYGSLRAHLRPHGMAVLNVTGPLSRVKSHLGLIERAFDGRALTIGVSDCRNRIVLAWNGELPGDWKAAAARAETLALRHGLDFPEYARLLQRAARKHGLRHAVREVVEPLKKRREKQ